LAVQKASPRRFRAFRFSGGQIGRQSQSGNPTLWALTDPDSGLASLPSEFSPPRTYDLSWTQAPASTMPAP